MCIIFDLDQTLVNTSLAEKARKERSWSNVYSLIPYFNLYEGMEEVFEFIQSNNIQVCIVSTSPRIYIEKIVKHFNIPCNHIVGYHDAKPIKPHPAPMYKAIELLDCQPDDIISFGDREIDLEAAYKANVKAIACLWGSNETLQLKQSKLKDGIISYPKEIIDFLL